MRKKCVSIGGQAVIEGVMMRGKRSMATAVRDENGNIVIESQYLKPAEEKSFLFRAPFLRGIFSFFGTMVSGVRTLMRSGEVFDGEAEPSKAEKWFAKTFKVDVFSVIMAISVVIGIALSVGLFFFLPQLITTGLISLFKINAQANVGVQIGMNFLEGFIRMLIFIGYIALTSAMKDIKRVYMYHGAEHKTISCYEHDLELTVENAQKMTTVHDRCGTTFMFITMVVSVLIFSLTGWSGQLWVRFLIRLALIPVVSGVSYEVLKFLAKFDNPLVRALKAPGLLLQKLTTRQPDDSMVEVAIAAFKTVLAMDEDPNLPEQKFDTKLLKRKVEEELLKAGVTAERAKEIICTGMGVSLEEYGQISHIKHSRAQLMLSVAKGEMTDEELAKKAVELNIKVEEAKKANEQALKEREEFEEKIRGDKKAVKKSKVSEEKEVESLSEEDNEADKDADKDGDTDK